VANVPSRAGIAIFSWFRCDITSYSGPFALAALSSGPAPERKRWCIKSNTSADRCIVQVRAGLCEPKRMLYTTPVRRVLCTNWCLIVVDYYEIHVTTDELRINNFIDSLKLSQRMFNLGMLISFLAIFVAFNPGGVEQAKIPIIDITINSREHFVSISAFFFLITGVYMNFAVKRCCSLITRIENEEFADAAKSYPSIVNSSFLYTIIMVGSLAGVWAAAITEAYNIKGFYGVILANIVITLYIHAARSSKKITPTHG